MAESDELREIVRKLKADGQSDAVIAQVVQRWDHTHRDKGLSDLPSKEFAGKLAESGSNFLTGLGETAVSLGRFGKNLLWNDPEYSKQNWQTAKDLVKATPELASQAAGFVGRQLSDIPGIPQRAFNAFYDDPIGIVGDVATLGTGVGAGLKATKVPKLVNAGVKLAKAADFIDPAAIAVRGAGHAVGQAGKLPIMTSLRPRNALTENFDVTRNQLARRVQTSGVTSLREAEAAETALGKRDMAQAEALGKVEGREWGDAAELIDAVDTGDPRTMSASLFRGGDRSAPKKVDKVVETLRTAHARPAPRSPSSRPPNVTDLGDGPIVSTVPPAQPPPPLARRGPGAQLPPGETPPALRMIGPGAAEGPLSPDRLLGTGEPTDIAAEIAAREAAMRERRFAALGEDPETGLAKRGAPDDLPVRATVGPGGAVSRPIPPRSAAAPHQTAAPSPFRPMSPAQMLEDKRTAQKRAFNAASSTKEKRDLSSNIQRTVARNLKEQTDRLFPELTKSAQETQEMMSVRQAFEDAEKFKPNRLGQFGAAATAGWLTGNPTVALGSLGVLSAIDSPRIGAKLGRGAYKFERAMVDPKMIALVRAMRAQGASEADIDRAIMQASLAEGKK